MGAKLKELLGLPSLREAQLMSGQNCLNQTVTSLSFLDISDMDDYVTLLETNVIPFWRVSTDFFFQHQRRHRKAM